MAKKDDIENSEYHEGDAYDDTYGLPDISYNPLDSTDSGSRKAETSLPPTERQEYSRFRKEEEGKPGTLIPSDDDDEPNRTWLWVLFLVLLLGIGLFLGYRYLFYLPEQSKQQEQALEQGRLQKEKKRREDSLARVHEREVSAPVILGKSAPPTQVNSEEGSIETLEGKTGNYFIVVVSSVDSDLVMDYAKKLKRKGKVVKILLSRGKINFTRLAVADFTTLQEAQGALETTRQEFDGAWVLHY